MSNTNENLKDAFAGESQANRRYLAFAKQADKEGLAHIAKLFRAAAAAETVHALNHRRAMVGLAKATWTYMQPPSLLEAASTTLPTRFC